MSFGMSPSLSLIPLASGQSPLCGSLAPTTSDWSALNATLGGRLYYGQPWAKPCFSTYNGNNVQPNEQECRYVQENFFNNHSNFNLQYPMNAFNRLFFPVNRSNAFGAYAAVSYFSSLLSIPRFSEDNFILNRRNTKGACQQETPAC